MEMLNREHLRTIRKAIENNRLAVFVGSAVSYDSHMPSWSDLIGVMKSALENPRNDDYLKIAEHYYLQFGRNTYYSKINEYFPPENQPNYLHELIIRLKPQHIITTNWDNLLEKAIINSGDLYFRVASDHDLAASPSSQLLVKMHGDLSSRNIIFKESDYHSYSDKFPLIENFIKSLFSTHIVIFIGYSISDYNLNQVLSWIRNRTQDAPPAFTILTESKITIAETNYLREKGIYPLLGEADINASSNADLSPKSKVVAEILKAITQPENIETLSILGEIAASVSKWDIIYPTTFVQLVKDRLSLKQINKLYYDSASNSVVYSLDETEKEMDRLQFRPIRKLLIKILDHLTTPEIRFTFSHKQFYRIKRRKPIEFADDYTTFNFDRIIHRVTSTNINLVQNLDTTFQFAFDNYFLRKLPIAKEAFLHLANRYFSKSQLVRSLVSAFNKKHLSFGEIPWEVGDSFIESSMEEQLSQNDNISDLIDKFPKSILSRQKALFQGLDASNTFMLERFKEIASLSREIDQEIKSISNGSRVYSSRTDRMYNQAHAIITFATKNKIAVLYSSDYLQIAQIAFESIIKRKTLTSEVKIDPLLSYMAIISFNEKGLVKFLSENLTNHMPLSCEDSTQDYLITALKNCASAIDSIASRSVRQHCVSIWSNALTLLSYIKHDAPTNSRIISQLIEGLDTTEWPHLSEPINRYLVVQFNRYSSSTPSKELELLLNKQIEKLNSRQNLPPQERGSLFSNLLYLIQDREDNSKGTLSENKELSKFLSNIDFMEYTDRLAAVRNFVFAIHSLAIGKLKDKTHKLMIDTFSLAEQKGLSESSIIFGLDLFNVGVINQDKLSSIFDHLKAHAQRHIKAGSTSSIYPTIREQLSIMDKSILSQYSDLVELVAKLSESYDEKIKRLS